MSVRFAAQAFDVLVEFFECRVVDHRTDVGRQHRRVADTQLLQRTADHLDHAVGNAVVHRQQTQRRATLAGGAERALHDRVDHLLGQRGTVDDHRVDTACFGDQRHDRALLVGERAVDELRDRGRSGEAHAGGARVGHQRGADRFAGTVQQHQRVRGDAGFVQQADHRLRNERCLLGRLGGHRVAGDERSRDLTGEDREREVPRADANEHAAPVQLQRVALAGRAGQRRSARACLRPRSRSSAGSRSPRALPPRRRRGSCALLSRAARRTRASAPAAGRQRAARRLRAGPAARRSTMESARASGASPRRCPPASLRARRRADATRVRGTAARALRRKRGRHRSSSAARRRRAAPAAVARAAARAPRRHTAVRRARPRSTTESSASWCTNDELAPFSSNRRTRYASRSRCSPTGA